MLGITYFLVNDVLRHPSLLAAFPTNEQQERLLSLTTRSQTWLQHAIDIGTGQLIETNDTPRGVSQCNWQEQVELGKILASNGVSTALASERTGSLAAIFPPSMLSPRP